MASLRKKHPVNHPKKVRELGIWPGEEESLVGRTSNAKTSRRARMCPVCQRKKQGDGSLEQPGGQGSQPGGEGNGRPGHGKPRGLWEGLWFSL